MHGARRRSAASGLGCSAESKKPDTKVPGFPFAVIGFPACTALRSCIADDIGASSPVLSL